MSKIVPYPSIESININSKKCWKDNYQFYFEEKIDGSQLSMFLNNNQLEFYNKNKLLKNNNQVFQKAITMLLCKFQDKNILNSNYIYHGEAVCNLRHNVNIYERTPKYYFIVYDIYDLETKRYLSIEDKHTECDRVGIEYVQVIYHNQDVECNPYMKADELIKEIESGNIKSCLGGIPEGVVLKHHAVMQKDKCVATKLKYVTDAFKERHKEKQAKRTEYSPTEFIEKLGKEFCVHARFQKAYQHLIEDNKIDQNDKNYNDISKIVGELDVDFDKEYKEEIMMLLWAEFSPIIKKYARDGVGLWYKDTYL